MIEMIDHQVIYIQVFTVSDSKKKKFRPKKKKKIFTIKYKYVGSSNQSSTSHPEINSRKSKIMVHTLNYYYSFNHPFIYSYLIKLKLK